MLLFNESMVMLYLYLLIGISDYNLVSELNDSLGIALLAIVVCTFLVNLLRFLQCFISRLFASVKRFRLWLKLRNLKDQVVSLQPQAAFGSHNHSMSTLNMMGGGGDQATVVSIDIIGKTEICEDYSRSSEIVRPPLRNYH